MKLMKILLVVLTVLALVLYAGLLVRDRYLLDKEPPVISFEDGTDPLTISVNDDDSALLAGITAKDNADGDVSADVKVRSISQLIGSNSTKVSYIVFDSSDNMATATRTVVYSDYEAPKFALTDELVFPIGKTVTLSDRLSAYDVLDGDISGAIRLSSENLNNYTEGVYSVSVMVTNSMGDTSVLPLTVIIRNESSLDPVITLSSHLVYLEQGSDFDPADYIDSLQDSSEGSRRYNFDDVTIESDVDTEELGVYTVFYTYENEDQRQTEAVLTVVVE